MAQVLLYNLPPEKLRRVRVALTRLGLRGRTVTHAEYGHPIGFLAGLEGFESAEEYTLDGFSSEMMVMCDLSAKQFSSLLDMLRASRAVVPLKAVVTETNASWNSVELHDALRNEHDTMQEYLAAKKKP